MTQCMSEAEVCEPNSDSYSETLLLHQNVKFGALVVTSHAKTIRRDWQRPSYRSSLIQFTDINVSFCIQGVPKKGGACINNDVFAEARI